MSKSSMKRKAGVEISEKGVEILLDNGERIYLNSLQDFISSEYSKSKLAVAISRDMVMVRKWRFPKDVLNNIEEAIYYNIDDIFPVSTDELKFVYHLTKIHEEAIEIMIIAIKREIYELFKSLRNVKLLIPSAYVYTAMESSNESMCINKGSYAEVVRIQNKVIMDWLLEESAECSSKIDVPALLLSVLNKAWKPPSSFIDRRMIISKKQLLYIASTVFLLLTSIIVPIVDIAYWKYKLSNIEKKIKSVEKLASERDLLSETISRHKAVIEQLDSRVKPVELLSVVSNRLPKESWLVSFSVTRNEFVIEGYAKDIKKTEEALRSSFNVVSFETREGEGLNSFTLKGTQ